jgi:hypothetical protein
VATLRRSGASAAADSVDGAREPVDAHFLHIGKTGGTALKHALEPAARRHAWLHLHPHATRLADVPRGQRAFFFLRDPIARFVSGFESRRRQGRPRYDYPWNEAEAEAFGTFASADSLARALAAPDPSLRERAIAAMRGIRHLQDSYWDWLGSPGELASRAGEILFIGRQEHLESDARRLGELLGVELAPLPADPVLAHRNPRPAEGALSEEARVHLAAWYRADYEAIDACVAIAQRNGFGGSLAATPEGDRPGPLDGA